MASNFSAEGDAARVQSTLPVHGVRYSVGDCVYLASEAPGAPFDICRILEFFPHGSEQNPLEKHNGKLEDDPSDDRKEDDGDSSSGDGGDAEMSVNWFLRVSDLEDPNDKICLRMDSGLGARELVQSEVVDVNPVGALRGKCVIKHVEHIERLHDYAALPDSFFYQYKRPISGSVLVVADPRDTDLRRKTGFIRIGQEYQADIPLMRARLFAAKRASVVCGDAIHVPEACLLSPEELDSYLAEARAITLTRRRQRMIPPVSQYVPEDLHIQRDDHHRSYVSAYGGVSHRDGFHAGAGASQDRAPANRSSFPECAMIASDGEMGLVRSLTMLERQKCDTHAALVDVASAPVDVETLDTWEEDERIAFDKGVVRHGKCLGNVVRDFLNHRAPGDVIAYYYLWKKRSTLYARCVKKPKVRETFDTPTDIIGTTSPMVASNETQIGIGGMGGKRATAADDIHDEWGNVHEEEEDDDDSDYGGGSRARKVFRADDGGAHLLASNAAMTDYGSDSSEDVGRGGRRKMRCGNANCRSSTAASYHMMSYWGRVLCCECRAHWKKYGAIPSREVGDGDHLVVIDYPYNIQSGARRTRGRGRERGRGSGRGSGRARGRGRGGVRGGVLGTRGEKRSRRASRGEKRSRGGRGRGGRGGGVERGGHWSGAHVGAHVRGRGGVSARSE